MAAIDKLYVRTYEDYDNVRRGHTIKSYLFGSMT